MLTTMRNMCRSLVFLFLKACIHAPVSAPATSFSLDDAATHAAIDKAQTEGNLPAIAVMMWKNGKNIFFNTQGKRSMQFDIKPEKTDQWHLGSDTKAMTAFLIAIAVEEGKLNYNLPISDFYDTPFSPKNQDLQIGHLLTHESGLKDILELDKGKIVAELSKSQSDLREQRRRITQASLATEPHLDAKQSIKAKRTFSYANINYIILGAILEKIYDMPWEQIIMKNLFQPLNMGSCGFGAAGDPTESSPSQPWPHVFENNQLIGVAPKHKLDNPAFIGPAGTVHCNLTDWQKFLKELSLVWHKKSTLLKNTVIGEKYFTTGQSNIYTFGGWGRIDNQLEESVFTHDGSNTFNYATAIFAPESDSGIFIATNSGRPEAEAAVKNLRKTLTRQLWRKK